MENKLIYVCCRIDQQTGREKHLGIMTENQVLNASNRYWEYTRKMLVPREKLEALHIGNVGNYLDIYEVF
jgi:hypothetical protein